MTNEKTFNMIARIGYIAVLLITVGLAFGSTGSRLSKIEKEYVPREVITINCDNMLQGQKRNSLMSEKILKEIEKIKEQLTRIESK